MQGWLSVGRGAVVERSVDCPDDANPDYVRQLSPKGHR